MTTNPSDHTTTPPRSEQPTLHADTIARAMREGIVFRAGAKSTAAATGKKPVKTKAKKKGYATGAHGSASAKKKADIRARRANRHKS